MSTTALSLYKLDLELLALIQAREDIATDPDLTPQEAEAALKAVDQQIAEYLPQALANRADEVANLIRQFEAMDKTDAEEIARIRDRRSKRIEARQYLENRVLELMERAEKKTIEGQHVTLKRVKNPPSAKVEQLDLVPDEYIRTTLKLPLALWTRICSHLIKSETGSMLFGELHAREVTRNANDGGEPMLSKIKDELKAGIGVPGCVLKQTERLEIK